MVAAWASVPMVSWGMLSGGQTSGQRTCTSPSPSQAACGGGMAQVVPSGQDQYPPGCGSFDAGGSLAYLYNSCDAGTCADCGHPLGGGGPAVACKCAAPWGDPWTCIYESSYLMHPCSRRGPLAGHGT